MSARRRLAVWFGRSSLRQPPLCLGFNQSGAAPPCPLSGGLVSSGYSGSGPRRPCPSLGDLVRGGSPPLGALAPFTRGVRSIAWALIVRVRVHPALCSAVWRRLVAPVRARVRPPVVWWVCVRRFFSLGLNGTARNSAPKTAGACVPPSRRGSCRQSPARSSASRRALASPGSLRGFSRGVAFAQLFRSF